MFSYGTLKTSLVVQTVKRLPTMWETRVQSLGREDLLEKGMATHSSILASPAPHPKKGLKEILRFPGDSEVKGSACSAGDPGLAPWVRKIPWRRKWQPTPLLLTGESHGRRSLVGFSPRGQKESGHFIIYWRRDDVIWSKS